MGDAISTLGGDLPIWLIVPLVAAIVFATRALGPVLMTRISLSPRMTRFLDGLAISVIVAMVATALAKAGLREAAAVALAVTVMLTARSVFWAMVAGIALAAAWSHFLPG